MYTKVAGQQKVTRVLLEETYADILHLLMEINPGYLSKLEIGKTLEEIYSLTIYDDLSLGLITEKHFIHYEIFPDEWDMWEILVNGQWLIYDPVQVYNSLDKIRRHLRWWRNLTNGSTEMLTAWINSTLEKAA